MGTPTCHHISFLYSVLRFASQLSFLCLYTHPCTDPDNSRLTVTAYSVRRFYSQQKPISLISDSRTESDRNYFSITRQSNSLNERVALMCNTYSKCMSVALVIQHAKHMHRIVVSPVACLDLPYFCTLPHKRHEFRKKKVMGRKHVFWFSLQFLSQIFLILRQIQWDIINICRSLCKISVILFIF